MSYSMGTNGVVVTQFANPGSRLALLDEQTWLYVVYPTAYSTFRPFHRMGSAYSGCSWGSPNNGSLIWSVITTGANENTTTDPIGVLNAWQTIAVTYSPTDHGRVYYAPAGGVFTEATYTIQGGGSGVAFPYSEGTLQAAGNLVIDSPFEGSFARMLCFRRRFTLAELNMLLYGSPMRWADTIALWHEFGYHGTGSVIDWSGQSNHSTGLAGATVADHSPTQPPFGFDTGIQIIGPHAIASPASAEYTVAPAIGIGAGTAEVTGTPAAGEYTLAAVSAENYGVPPRDLSGYPYVRQYDFQKGRRGRADELDTEFDAIAAGFINLKDGKDGFGIDSRPVSQDAVVITHTPARARALQTGDKVIFKAVADPSGPGMTLQVDGQDPKPLVIRDGSDPQYGPFAPKSFNTGEFVEARYDGTSWRMPVRF